MIYSSLIYQDTPITNNTTIKPSENIELDLEMKDSVNIENNVNKIDLGMGGERKNEDIVRDNDTHDKEKENNDNESKQNDCLN